MRKNILKLLRKTEKYKNEGKELGLNEMNGDDWEPIFAVVMHPLNPYFCKI